MQKIELDEYLKHKESEEYAKELTKEKIDSAVDLLKKVNGLIKDLNENGVFLEENDSGSYVNSGWRPLSYNKKIGGALKSNHILCKAIDLADSNRKIGKYLLEHQHLLTKHALYAEHPSATKSWIHLQSVPPKSKRLFFYP